MDDFIKQGSGNVYEDLGYADADEMKVKADIVSHIASETPVNTGSIFRNLHQNILPTTRKSLFFFCVVK